MTTKRKPPILPMRRNQNYSLEEFTSYIDNYDTFIHYLQSYCNTHEYEAIDGVVTRYRSKRVFFLVAFAKNKGKKNEHWVTVTGVINGVNKVDDKYYVTNIHFDHNVTINPTMGE